MPVFRPRLRTNQGCARCRKRRTKCDEGRPACGPCKRIGALCPYLQPADAQAQPSVQTDGHPSVEEAPALAIITVRDSFVPISVGNPFGYTEEIGAVLQFCSTNHSKTFQTPGKDPSEGLLAILPVVVDDPMVLAALTATLSLFMPRDWVHTTWFPLELVHQAVRHMSTALSALGSSPVPNRIILAAGLLYLFDLHSQPEPSKKWSHLFGIGAMLKTRLQPTVQQPNFPISALESYIFHLVLNSTVDFSVVPKGVTPDFIDQCIGFFAKQCQCEVSKAKMLFVPVIIISALFELATYRNELLSESPSDETVARIRHLTCFRNRQRYPEPINNIAVEIIYMFACRIFRNVLLRHASVENSSHNIISSDQETAEVKEAVRYICCGHTYHHVVVWPLFIIALGSADPDIRQQITKYLTEYLENARIQSIRGVIDILELSWENEMGLSILLMSQLSSVVMF